MGTAIEYERLKTSIVDFNLSIAEEPVPGTRGNDPPSGFLAELYVGPRVGTQSGHLNNKWHINYRESY